MDAFETRVGGDREGGLEIHEVAIIGWDVYATNFIPFYNTLEIRAMI